MTFAPALAYGQPFKNVAADAVSARPHYEYMRADLADVGQLIAILANLGANYVDTLGNFRPVVITSTGITINTSENHPNGITLHDSKNAASVDPVLGMQNGLSPTFFPSVANNSIAFGVVNAPTVGGVTSAVYLIAVTTGGNPRIQTYDSTGSHVIHEQTHIVRTKAGAPVDGDFGSPADGMLVVDTTTTRVYLRAGGVWVPVPNFGAISGETIGAATVNGVANTAARNDHQHQVLAGQAAGAPADAPSDGTLRLDSTGVRLYARIGGAWKSVVLA